MCLDANDWSRKVMLNVIERVTPKKRKMSDPAVFLIEEDNDARSLLRENLKAGGYKVLLAID